MFASILDNLLTKAEVTRYQVSKETGIAQSRLSDYLAGKVGPSVKHLLTLAEYFNVTTDYLLGRETASEPSISAEEYAIVRAWRSCPDDMKPAVLRLLGIEASREESVVS